MADILLGDVVARLRMDTAEFVRSIQQATQQLQTLQQRVQAPMPGAGLTQAAQAATSLSQQAQTAAQAMQQLGRSATQSGSAMAAFQQQTGAVNAQLAAVSSTASRMGGALQGALSVAGGIGLATSIGAIANQMKELVTSTIQVGAAFQQLRVSLNTITGGQGQQAFSELVRLANQYGQSIEGLAQPYRSFLAATRGTVLEGREASRMFESLVQASRTYGLSTEQTGRALLAFQQIIGKGKVEQEELRGQLAEALPGAVQIAARAFGVTTAALNEMVTKGVDAIEFTRAFTAQLQREMPNAAQTVQTAGQAFNRLANEVSLLKDAAVKSGFLDWLRDVTNELANVLQRSREVREQQQRFSETQSRQALGTRPGAALPPASEAMTRLDQINRELAAAETRRAQQEETLARMREMPGMSPARLLAAQRVLEMETGIVEQLRRQQTEQAALIRVREQQRLGVQAREQLDQPRDLATEEREAAQAREQANKRLQDALATTRQQLELLNKESKETPQAFGSLAGNADAQLEFLSNRIKILRENLESITTLIVQRTGQQGQVPPELAQQKATFAQQLAQAEQQKEAIQEAVRAAARAEREAEQAREKAIRDRQHLEEQQARQRIANEVAEIAAEERAMTQLRQLAASYLQTKEARDADRATTLTGALANTKYAEEAQGLNKAIQDSATVLGTVDQRLGEAASSWNAFQRAKDAATKEDTALQRMGDVLERLRAPREERLDVRLTQMRRDVTSEEGQRRATQIQAQARMQERLNEAARLFGEVGSSVGQAWTSALLGIAQHTTTVAGAFKAMAQSIMASLIQIASSEAWRALIRLGVSALTSSGGGSSGGSLFGGGSGFSGGAGGSFGGVDMGGAFGGSDIGGFQHGGIINKPTIAMLGEGGQTEYVLNQSQMNAMLGAVHRASPSAGGQAAGGHVSVILVDNRAQADQMAAQELAKGNYAVVQVIENMRKGEGSEIVRMIRQTQR